MIKIDLVYTKGPFAFLQLSNEKGEHKNIQLKDAADGIIINAAMAALDPSSIKKIKSDDRQLELPFSQDGE